MEREFSEIHEKTISTKRLKEKISKNSWQTANNVL
jgi:hypothetical protein